MASSPLSNSWLPCEPDVASICQRFSEPLNALAAAETPALVLREAMPPEACNDLVRRLTDEGFLFDPGQPMPERFREQVIPEGHYSRGRDSVPQQAWRATEESGRTRIDIGSSLGYRGADKEAFLAHSQQTHALFDQLFAAALNPVQLLYESLEQLAGGRKVVTAHEPDGRRYGPAIIRAHYGGYTYKPHFDSVRLREQREDYAVHQFEHQFAGVLVLQNSRQGERTAQCKLHRCLWQPEVDPHLQQDTFEDYARERSIENVEVCLQPGDLYFFNTRCIHEVPGVNGELPRIVLATFIGYSRDRDELFVWS